MKKRIGFISYPMLFQKKGGLQIQVLETKSALEQLGVDVKLVDVLNDDLAIFDILHVFSANHGNHNIVHTAKEKGCKVVMSPLAEDKWTEKYAKRSKIFEPLISKLTGYLNYSFFSMVSAAFKKCDHLIALGEAEKKALVHAFDIDSGNVSIVANGIPQRFFTASPEHFRRTTNIQGDFVLNIASIDKNKNQLVLAKVMKRYLPSLKLVLIGPVLKSNYDYLEAILKVGNTTYLGAFDYQSEMLPSAYAAATVFVLPSVQEVLPLSALESLAAGTPAIVTKVSSMAFDCQNNEFSLVDPNNHKHIAQKIEQILNLPPSVQHCKDLVVGLTWREVAEQLVRVYSKL